MVQQERAAPSWRLAVPSLWHTRSSAQPGGSHLSQGKPRCIWHPVQLLTPPAFAAMPGIRDQGPEVRRRPPVHRKPPACFKYEELSGVCRVDDKSWIPLRSRPPAAMTEMAAAPAQLPPLRPATRLAPRPPSRRRRVWRQQAAAAAVAATVTTTQLVSRFAPWRASCLEMSLRGWLQEKHGAAATPAAAVAAVASTAS